MFMRHQPKVSRKLFLSANSIKLRKKMVNNYSSKTSIQTCGRLNCALIQNYGVPISTPIRTYGISSSTFFTSEKSKEDIIKGALMTSHINPIWLRENCRCEKCYTHSTNQRHVLFHHFDSHIKPYAVHEKNGSIEITWSDGHKSVYDHQWIKDNIYPGRRDKLGKVYWDRDTLEKADIPYVAYKDFMNDDDSLRTMLKCLYTYGIGLVTGVPPDVPGTQKASERVCFIQETFFGTMWQFTADMARADTAYTNIALGAHTDGTYLMCSPGIQVFHCIYHDGTGGETLLVDGFSCIEKLRKSDPVAFELLATLPIHHEYKEQNMVHTESLGTVIRTHPATEDLVQLRYNHYDRSPISTIPQKHVGQYYEALRKLSAYVEDPAQEYWLKLRPGTMLFVDNWRTMHGRAAFTGKRSVCGCYLHHDDWISRTRTLQVI